DLDPDAARQAELVEHVIKPLADHRFRTVTNQRLAGEIGRPYLFLFREPRGARHYHDNLGTAQQLAAYLRHADHYHGEAEIDLADDDALRHLLCRQRLDLELDAGIAAEEPLGGVGQQCEGRRPAGADP